MLAEAEHTVASTGREGLFMRIAQPKNEARGSSADRHAERSHRHHHVRSVVAFLLESCKYHHVAHALCMESSDRTKISFCKRASAHGFALEHRPCYGMFTHATSESHADPKMSC